MSASSKKKLRNEQNAEKMTQQQMFEQKEAKKLKIYTSIFCVVLALIVVVAAVTLITRTVTTSGVLQRNAVAATVGDHEINGVEMNYYYVDAVNKFYSEYYYYISYFLDTTLPLDEQMADSENGITWADYFIDAAVGNAAYIYALCDAAEAAGYTLSEDEISEIEYEILNAEFYAMYYYGYEDLESYLKALYGTGSDEESYREYLTMNTLAQSYYDSYTGALTYTDEQINAHDDENALSYNSYDYNYYYLAVSNYLTGGTTDEEGNTTYSDEEQAAAVTAAEADAIALTGETVTDVETLDLAIALLKSDETAASTDANDIMYDSVLSYAQEWITDSSRTSGDVTYVARTSTSTAEDGTETESVVGYYVVMFDGSNDNSFALKNVRHCLITPTGGTTDDSGNTTYSDEEWAAALAEAEALLEEWKSGDATEDSFAEMANTNSYDGDGTTGGLYTDIYPDQMVANFEDWCYDDSRVTGDTGIVESEYGYHIMYFVGNSDISYREYLITEDLKSAEIEAWYTALLEAMPAEAGNTKYVNTSLVLSAS